MTQPAFSPTSQPHAAGIAEKRTHIAPSLGDVIVAETTLSHVDGAHGDLIIRGHRIDNLAGVMTFEDVAKLLWEGFLPAPTADIQTALAKARNEAFETAKALSSFGRQLEVIEWMRLCLDALPISRDTAPAIQITGAMPVFLASGFRLKSGKNPVAPNPDASLAFDLLTMLHDQEPTEIETQSLDRYLVTIADHGLNASTFTARVIASTQSDMRSAISGAIGALKGPLHGGAPGPVLDMIDAIGSPDRADAWIAMELAKGHRLMGFGHRIYQVRDPRADILKQGLAKLQMTSQKVAHAVEIEHAALKALAKHKPERSLQTNVEFYTAILLDAIDIDRSLFTPLFAVGRTAGWTAHVMEQAASNKLIRPQSLYVGPAPR